MNPQAVKEARLHRLHCQGHFASPASGRKGKSSLAETENGPGWMRERDGRGGGIRPERPFEGAPRDRPVRCTRRSRPRLLIEDAWRRWGGGQSRRVSATFSFEQDHAAGRDRGRRHFPVFWR